MDETTRKTEWDGVVRKCPNCGAALSSMTAFCHECGYELSERQSSNNVQEFVCNLTEMKFNLANIYGKTYTADYGIAEKAKEVDEMNKKIVSYISSFPIPNTVEDISELMLYAVGNTQIEMGNASYKGGALNKSEMIGKAWRVMVDRCYSKAKLSFGETKEFAKIARLYKKVKKAEKRCDWQVNILIAVIPILFAVGIGFGLSFIFGNVIGKIGGRIVGIIGGLLVWYPITMFMGKVFWPKPILHR